MQFTNPYNTQTGQIGQPQNTMQNQMAGMPMPGGNQGAWQPQPSTPQPTTIPNDWRPYQTQPALPSLNGRWVNSFDDIRPMDVPQDGSLTLFPQADKSCIYAMCWTIDGQIRAFRFVPEKIESQTPSPSTNDSDPVKEVLTGFTASMFSRMDSLESRIGDILSRFETVTPTTKTKKPTTKEGEQA